MRKICSVVSKYTIAFFVLIVVFCLALILCGLGGDSAQNRIMKNMKSSYAQFEKENVYPYIFAENDYSSRLDNHTDMRILMLSMYTNTSEDYTTIFNNPYLSLSNDEESEMDYRIYSFKKAVEGEKPNSKYTYYWAGFRVFIRPLLVLLTISQYVVLFPALFCSL